jgi:hypothetical protein
MKNFCDILEKLRVFIIHNKCEELRADISPLNLVDAAKTALTCSTLHFAKYPRGKIFWEVADEQTKQTISAMQLKNMQLTVKREDGKEVLVRS